VRLYRDEDLNGYQFEPDDLNLTEPQVEQLRDMFESGRYEDVAGGNP
jgi:hypothetical protein